MAHGWKVLAISEREAIIKEIGGETVTVRVDASSGYSFVSDYLRLLSRNYSGHLRAADLLMQKMLGEQYKFVRASDRMYRARLALISLSCAFGVGGNVVDFDDSGNMNFRYVSCPLRSVCPMNGYSLKSRNGMACCNPIYETGLTPRLLELAELLVNTSYAYKDIAEMMNIAEGRVRNMACEIFAVIGVSDRQELTVFLRGKRIV